jgi:hypothetical protein
LLSLKSGIAEGFRTSGATLPQIAVKSAETELHELRALKRTDAKACDAEGVQKRELNIGHIQNRAPVFAAGTFVAAMGVNGRRSSSGGTPSRPASSLAMLEFERKTT